MKVYVHYDASGAIHSLVAVDAPADHMPSMVPEPGLLVGEVDGKVPGWKYKGEVPDLEGLRQVAHTLRVATPVSLCKLVKK